MQIAVVIQVALVARSEPPTHKSFGVGFGVILISAKNIGSLNNNFAALAGAEVVSKSIHDADTDSSTHSHRTRLAAAWRQRIRGHLMRRFGHAIRFNERYAEDFFHLVNGLCRKWRAARTDKPQRTRVADLVTSTRQDHLVHRWHSRVPGHTVLAHQSPKRKRIELGG